MPMHRVLIKHKGPTPVIGYPESVNTALRRLREHGYEPTVGEVDAVYGTAIDFLGPAAETLDFLRPDLLPPR